jgi:dihydrofolate synthase/folylpolyglutamate synthase
MTARPAQRDSFDAAVAYLHALDQRNPHQHTHAYAFGNGIARARHLLSRLGDAPRVTRRCVLIAGSKGKGSTAAMLAAMLSASGYRVGLFTGPHLYSPLERFAIGCSARLETMSEAQFIAFAERIAAIIATWDRPEIGLPTRFEAFTAMAYRWFEEQRVDLAVMEIGIGGRHDAVNLAEPLLSVITNISLEHTQILGHTLAEIAWAKAGILRARGSAVIAPQTDEARRVLLAEANRLGMTERLYFVEDYCTATLSRVQVAAAGLSGQWVRIHPRPSALLAQIIGTCDELFCPLLGIWQVENLATALTALSVLHDQGLTIHAAALRAGLAGLRWPARFEILRSAPLVIADGAHTPHAMAQLRDSLRAYFPSRPIHFVLGVLRDKDAQGILEAIADDAARIIFTEPPTDRALPAAQLLKIWQMHRHDAAQAIVISDPALALQRALDDVGASDIICVAGSLHLAAGAVRQLTPQPKS